MNSFEDAVLFARAFALRMTLYEIGFWAAATAAVVIYPDTREYGIVPAGIGGFRMLIEYYVCRKKMLFWEKRIAKLSDDED